jgi:hypothetical protein
LIFLEPTAYELIEEFLSVDTKNVNSKPTSERIVDVDVPPSPPTATTPAPLLFTRKQLALKILALKVAATLHWNLGKLDHPKIYFVIAPAKLAMCSFGLLIFLYLNNKDIKSILQRFSISTLVIFSCLDNCYHLFCHLKFLLTVIVLRSFLCA